MKSGLKGVSCVVSKPSPETIGKSSDFEKTFEQMLLDCLRHLKAESGSLFLRLKKDTRLKLVKAIGRHENHHCGKIISIGEGVSGFVAEKKEPLLVSDLVQAGSFVSRRERTSLNTFMSCPVLNGSSVLAVINVSGRKDGRPFQPKDLRQLQKLSKVFRPSLKEMVEQYSAAHAGALHAEPLDVPAFTEAPEAIAETLEELRKYSSIILHSLSRFVLVFDRTFRIVYCSNKKDFSRLFSGNGKTKLKQNILDLPLDVERPNLKRKLEGLLLKGNPFSLSNIRIKHPSDVHIVNMFFSPFLSTQGRLLGGLLLIDDNTKMHEMQQRLFEAEKFSFIGSLMSMISHEVNIPLDGINRLMNLSLDRLHESDPVREYLMEAQKGVQRISSLVMSLLGFSRKSSSSEIDSLPLTRVLDEAVSVIRNRNAGKNVLLHLNYGPEVPRVNANDFYQVATNIIANAFDAVAPGLGNVALETNVREEMLHMTVRDDGCGIPKKMLPRLFEPFFSSKHLGRGTGLGLAIVKKIVEKYDGNILVESEEGCGTAIHLTFPMGKVING